MQIAWLHSAVEKFPGQEQRCLWLETRGSEVGNLLEFKASQTDELFPAAAPRLGS